MGVTISRSVVAPIKVKQVEVNFGNMPSADKSFTVTDADVTASSIIIGWLAYAAPTNKDLDELDMDLIDLKFMPGDGQFTVWATPKDGYVADKFKINYLIS